MKTAEEITQEMITRFPIEFGVFSKPYIIEAMKQYAKQVAEEVISNAVDHVSNLPYVDGVNETLFEIDVMQVIGSTPIITP